MRKIAFYWSIIFVLIILCLASCKTAEDHFRQFQKKGGKVNCVSDTIQVLDTLVINGDTIYHWRPQIVVKDSIHYVTKYEVRYRYKTAKEQGKTDRTESRQETKQTRSDNSVAKTEKRQEAKTERAKMVWWLWLLIGWISGIVTILAVWVIYLINVGRKMPFK